MTNALNLLLFPGSDLLYKEGSAIVSNHGINFSHQYYIFSVIRKVLTLTMRSFLKLTIKTLNYDAAFLSLL